MPKEKSAALKDAEIRLSVSIACHSSISTVHVGEIVKESGSGSVWADCRLHHTKCAAIIKNVIGKSIKDELCQQLADKRYSILIDESTDISNKKILVLTIR
jgi:hypothetical protein